jgi:hypothetical protein
VSAARDASFDKIHFPNRIKEKALQRVAVVESAPSYAAFPCCRAVAASLTAIIRVADSHTSYLVPWIVEARVVTKRRASTRRARQMISVSCVQISLNVLWDNISKRTIVFPTMRFPFAFSWSWSWQKEALRFSSKCHDSFAQAP